MTTPLSRAVREHGDALAATIDTLSEVIPEAWSRPWSPGKWTAGQIVQHLVLAYEVSLRELAGGAAARPRLKPAWQKLLRIFLLPHVLFHRSFPLAVRAPREWRPAGEDTGEPAEVLSSLTETARRFEQEAARAHEEGRPLHHPYFGPVDALRALRLAAVHLEHHRQQILGCLVTSR